MRAIDAHLDGLSPDITRISVKSLKKDLGLTRPEEKKLFSRALTQYLEENEDQWERDGTGRSLVRTWAELFRDETPADAKVAQQP